MKLFEDNTDELITKAVAEPGHRSIWPSNFIVPFFHPGFGLLLFPSKFFQRGMPHGQRFGNANSPGPGK